MTPSTRPEETPAADSVERPRPQLPGGTEPDHASVATELRRFHAGPRTEGSPSVDSLRSAAVAAVATLDDADPGKAAETLLAGEGEITPDDDTDLRAGTPLALLRLAVRRRLLPRRDGFLVTVQSLARRLREKLDVDLAKDEARKPEHLEGAISSAASSLIDVSALSAMIGPERGSMRLSESGRRRIADALETLQSFSFAEEASRLTVVHDGTRSLAPADDVRFETAADPAAEALRFFDAEAERLAPVFRAARIARLEVENAYDEAHHDPWFDRFGPDSLSGDERLLLPVVAALETVDHLEANGLLSFSRLLVSGRPVHLMVTAVPERSPELDDESTPHERLEPAYVAMGHRKAFVQQSSAGHPLHLLRGLLASLDHARPALHVLDPAEGPEDVAAARAARFGRAHPCFRYDPAAGLSWAGRLDFTGNPEPEAAWPTAKLECDRHGGGTETLSLHVTFADFVLGDPGRRSDFHVVPAGCPAEAIAPLAEWLDLDEDHALFRVPWIWAMDPEGVMRRVAVTRRLAVVCRDRLDYWHTLQELAGVRNEYVTEAVRHAETEGAERAAAERSRLLAEHAEQLATSKKDAVEQAMSSLARRLLELDPSAPPLPAAAGALTAPPAAAAPVVQESAPPPSPDGAGAAAAEAPAEEAWINTPLCTSCNDCTNINPRLFVYDANKQAVMGDLQAGTFAQLVQAAEKCPARCIHPGSPWNPDEPGLDKLIQRAAPLQ